MIVVKIGGSRGIDLDAVVRDISARHKAGEKLVVVHGGSSLATELGEKLGHPPVFVTSLSGYTSRRTDRKTLEIFEMACAGRVNKDLVERFQRLGTRAVGLSGLDGRIWEGPRKAAIKVLHKGKRLVLRDDYTGKVERVNIPLLRALLSEGFLPVLCPPAASYEGEAVNVDGDRAAAATAAALQAETLVILSNVPGLLGKFPDESTLIPHIPAGEVERFMEVALDRMKKKVMGAAEALQAGVKRVIFADGRVEKPLEKALAGRGTVIGEKIGESHES